MSKIEYICAHCHEEIKRETISFRTNADNPFERKLPSYYTRKYHEVWVWRWAFPICKKERVYCMDNEMELKINRAIRAAGDFEPEIPPDAIYPQCVRSIP